MEMICSGNKRNLPAVVDCIKEVTVTCKDFCGCDITVKTKE